MKKTISPKRNRRSERLHESSKNKIERRTIKLGRNEEPGSSGSRAPKLGVSGETNIKKKFVNIGLKASRETSSGWKNFYNE
ncbi:MAG: hypothetical protein K1X66_04120 [Verrucomicrobiae bacterium]|nr:hypothetical protein [Verrucomicrobiae bacterium]